MDFGEASSISIYRKSLNSARRFGLENSTNEWMRFDVTIAGELNLDLILYGVSEEIARGSGPQDQEVELAI